MDDRELLAAWQAGDAKAGGQLVDRHFDTLLRFFVTKVPGKAEDLVQETLLGCVQARDRFPSDVRFEAFMLGIARNKLLMFWRTKGRRGEEIDFAETSLEALGLTATQALAEQDKRRLLLRALRRLPVELQIIMELYYWENLRGPQLAAALEIPEGTVRGRIRRGRTLLAEFMAELGAEAGPVGTQDSLDAWLASMHAKPDRPALDDTR